MRHVASYDDSVAWDKHDLAFLRRFAPFYQGIFILIMTTPEPAWMRTLAKLIDPLLFSTCFDTWTAALNRPGMISSTLMASHRGPLTTIPCAGEAFFAIISLIVTAGALLDIVGDIGNAVVTVVVCIISDRSSVEKPMLALGYRG